MSNKQCNENSYQVFARKYRPQTFGEVLGQDAIVTTLKNAIKYNRLAHAYLFCGSRGTGKTTLARVFAKALNCSQRDVNFEPCNQCSSCKEISLGNSLDVLEIDGASNRGIDDIRQINETVGYTTASGGHKIYIIDEVHMLTKEAFNALLKTLEEPPEKVKFFFATTEPHKVLPTILSRCQRYNLNRIPQELIINKLQRIAYEANAKIEDEALQIIAQRAEGGLRDAESLLDQILAYHENEIVTAGSVAGILGVMPREVFFELDRAGKEGNLSVAFDIAHRVFSEGKDLLHFVEMLAEHFRTILLIKISGADTPLLSLSKSEKQKYDEAAKLYGKEQCLSLLDYLMEMQNKMRHATTVRVSLETVLLYIMRSHFRVPIEILVQRLHELEKKLSLDNSEIPNKNVSIAVSKTPPTSLKASQMTIDPTPSDADLGIKSPLKTKAPSLPVASPPVSKAASQPISAEKQQRYDTLLQFSAIELEGVVQKNIQNTRK